MGTTSGLDLKLARVARGVTQRAMARRLGVLPQRVSAIEATYRPTTETCARYFAALRELSDELAVTQPFTRGRDR